jgi:hypothetical protein
LSSNVLEGTSTLQWSRGEGGLDQKFKRSLVQAPGVPDRHFFSFL